MQPSLLSPRSPKNLSAAEFAEVQEEWGFEKGEAFSRINARYKQASQPVLKFLERSINWNQKWFRYLDFRDADAAGRAYVGVKQNSSSSVGLPNHLLLLTSQL